MADVIFIFPFRSSVVESVRCLSWFKRFSTSWCCCSKCLRFSVVALRGSLLWHDDSHKTKKKLFSGGIIGVSNIRRECFDVCMAARFRCMTAEKSWCWVKCLSDTTGCWPVFAQVRHVLLFLWFGFPDAFGASVMHILSYIGLYLLWMFKH